jgi:hypothetical protein
MARKIVNRKLDKQRRIEANESRQLRDGADVPPTVNNFLTNIPTACKSRNDELERALRDVQRVNATVNGKIADSNLIHKPGLRADEQRFFPVIEDSLLAKKEKHGKR